MADAVEGAVRMIIDLSFIFIVLIAVLSKYCVKTLIKCIIINASCYKIIPPICLARNSPIVCMPYS